MAPRNTQQHRFAVRFELGIGGLLGLTVVCLCIFLWIFMLGVWAGQTVLSPSSSESAPWLHRVASELLPTPAIQEEVPAGHGEEPEPPVAASVAATEEAPVAAPVAAEAGQEEAVNPVTVKEEAAASTAPTCFSLQVGAFRDEANAAESVAAWKVKGYEAFTLAPQEGSHLHRVFVGRFEDLAAANKMVAVLEEKEQLRAYITLIPVD